VTRIELAPEVGEDLDRIVAQLQQHEVARLESRIEDIIRAIDVLARNPMIGRAARAELRELVIGKGGRGYVALYRYVAAIDTVLVLAIRGQKEAGFP
jgi:plasmid stabilization system protein ParE